MLLGHKGQVLRTETRLLWGSIRIHLDLLVRTSRIHRNLSLIDEGLLWLPLVLLQTRFQLWLRLWLLPHGALQRKQVAVHFGGHARERRLFVDNTKFAQDGNIKVGWEADRAGLREVSKPRTERKFAISVAVVVGTVRLLAGVSVQAGLHLEEVGVELLLLPAMTEGALVLELAAVLVGSDEVLGVPVRAHLLRVGEHRGFAPVVLPVVRVHAHVSLVVVLSVGAPHSLEVEDVEVHVRLELLNQLHRQLTLGVGEGAELAVLALRMAVEVRRTELGFVFVWMIKLFNSIVSLITCILIWTILMVLYIPAFL